MNPDGVKLFSQTDNIAMIARPAAIATPPSTAYQHMIVAEP